MASNNIGAKVTFTNKHSILSSGTKLIFYPPVGYESKIRSYWSSTTPFFYLEDWYIGIREGEECPFHYHAFAIPLSVISN